MHISMFDAVDLIVGGYDVYGTTANAPPGASPKAAAAAAAHRVLSRTFAGLPQCTAGTACGQDVLDAALASDLSSIPDGPSKDDGVALGIIVADQIFDLRASDGAYAVLPPYTGGANAGQPGGWVPTPPAFAAAALPQWANMTPFVMTSPDQFLSDPPPAFTDEEWVESYNETQLYGDHNSTVRTSDQTDAAIAWSPNAVAIWNVMARQIAARRPNDLITTARIFALLDIGITDAAIGLWNAKFHYSFWAPVTAIQAGTDGNPATTTDPNWLPLLKTPAYPVYPSGHPGGSEGAAYVLEYFYGDKTPCSFTTSIFQAATTDGLPNRPITRHYKRISDAIRELIDARVWAGIDYRFSDVAAVVLGKKAAEYAVNHALVAHK